MLYAVIDTNFLVSALLSRFGDSSTVVVRNYILEGTIIPLYNEEILQEYLSVLHRPKFQIPPDKVDGILDAIIKNGLMLGRTSSGEMFLRHVCRDAKDRALRSASRYHRAGTAVSVKRYS